MSLEAIKEVSQAEREASALRADRAAEARYVEAEAEKSGLAHLEEKRAEAEAKAAEIMKEAEAEAEQASRASLDLARKDCEALRQQAESRLGSAVDAIVGRIVNG